MRTKIINPLVDEDWDRMILQHPDCSLFHSAAWARVLCKTYRHDPQYLCCFRKGELMALVPIMEVSSPLTGRRGVGLPFTDLCKPLVFQEEAWEIVLHGLSELAHKRKWKHFELRGGSIPSHSPSIGYCEHHLDLTGTEQDLFANFSSASRRAIRKAEKSPLEVEATQSRQALLDFYRLHVQTRRRHGVPPQPISFFRNIHEEVIARGLGFIVIAHKDSIPVSAAVYFHFGKHAIYKFGASDQAYQEFRGNNLVMWKGIQLLQKGGFEKLHFGRTSMANEGLRKFKLGWGSEEKPLAYLKFRLSTGQWEQEQDRTRGFHTQIFGRLPAFINCLAGALIYPHLD